jgi:hypothetical protein
MSRRCLINIYSEIPCIVKEASNKTENQVAPCGIVCGSCPLGNGTVMEKYACCAGCESSGGPPDCTIKICARERGYELCSFCHDPDSCTNFEWLKEHGSKLKEKLKESRRLPKEEYIRR